MDDKRFIEIAKEFLIYSFETINFNYEKLTLMEKEIITEEEFKKFINKILNDN